MTVCVHLQTDTMDHEQTGDFLYDLGIFGPHAYYGEVTGAVLFQLSIQLLGRESCSSLLAGLPHMAPAEVLALVPFWLDEDEEPGGPEFWHPPAYKAEALRKIGRAFRERMPGAQQLWTRVWGNDDEQSIDWFRKKMLWRIDVKDPNWPEGDWAAHCAYDFECLATSAETLGAHGARMLRLSYHV